LFILFIVSNKQYHLYYPKNKKSAKSD